MGRRASRTGSGGRAAPLGLLAFGLAIASGCSEPTPRPNHVVLITIDTLRADRIGVYGDASAHTPTLDALARDGVRFRSVVSPTPLTLPTHASLLTGLDPHQHGVRANGRFTLSAGIPTVAERMREAGFGTAAFVASFVLDSRFGLDRGFDRYDDRLFGERASRAALSVSERKAASVVDAAVAWLDEAPERFFLWIHLYDPHADYVPPVKYLALAGGDPYGGEIAYTDAQVGRLLAALVRRFGRDDLLIAVTSDHGESLGAHGELTHGHGLYDTTQRIPLLMFGPGLRRGQVVVPPVRLIDVGPTLLARAGAAPLGDVAGRDLTPLIEGREEEPRNAYLETLETQLTYGWSPLLGLRTATHKYVRAPRPELYDLTADPDERVNLAVAEPERAAELDAALDAMLGARRWDAGTVEIDAAERRRLEALGYVGAGGETRAGAALGEVGGPNPRDRVHEVSMLMRAALLVGEGDGAAALDTLEGIQSRDNRHYQQLRGQAALLLRDPERTRDAGDRLRALGEEADGLWYRAMAALLDGDAVQARRDFEALGAAAPGHTEAALYLGRIDEIEGDPAAAAARYREALASAPDDPLAIAHVAALELAAGHDAAADALLADRGDAIASEPRASLHLAAAEAAAGRPEAARRRLRAALREHPRHPGLRAAWAAHPAGDGE